MDPAPGVIVGAFRLEARIGRGGMGEVWKAWDTRLSRHVAVKFMRGVEAEEVARFHREARVAAGLDHPNIAAVYEVGPDFIAMQLVEGTTLGKARAKPMEAARFIRDAARAVQAAHDAGIIHRDLKPDNIMVTPAGHVYVMDFGLARAIREASHLTASGMAVGTPAYMSPEQARGDPADARSDVYGLGATLFDLATGRAPFAGTTAVEILLKVAQDDPPDPRAVADIDPDLEAVILRCMEKDPERRYPTAAALADDLDRLLHGEGVSASRTGIARKVGRGFLRRRWIVATVVAVAALAGVSWWFVGRAEREATRAEEALLRQMRETTDACLAAALDLRRADDLEGMRRQAAKVEEICAKVSERLPGLAEPHYRRGRMYRALMRHDEALAEVRRALELEPGHAAARYERVVLLGRLFARRTRALEYQFLTGAGVTAHAHDAPTADPVRRKLAEEAEADVAFLRQAPAAVAPAEFECAEGLVAWMARADAEEARRRLGSALSLEEATETLSGIETDKHRYDEAIRLCTEALKADAGYAPHYENRAMANYVRVVHDRKMPAGAAAMLKAACADLDEAVKRNPTREAQIARGVVHSVAAVNGAPERFESALEAFSEAHRMDGTTCDAIGMRGRARLWWGIEAASMTHLQGALEDVETALAKVPDALEPLQTRAETRRLMAELVGDLREACGLLRQSIEDYGAVIRKYERDVDSWRGRGMARMELGERKQALGESPREEYEAAAKDFEEAWTRRHEPLIQVQRGRALEYLAAHLWSTGGDGKAASDAALAAYDAAIAHDAKDAEAWLRRAEAWMDRGRAAYARGGDGTAEFRASIADFTESLRLDPKGPWERRGSAISNWVQYWPASAEKGKAYEAALRDFEAAVKAKPRDGLVRIQRANALFDYAGWTQGRRENPIELYAKAEDECTEAIRIGVRKADSHFLRGRVLYAAAGYAGEVMKADVREGYRAAAADFGESARLEPGPARAWLWRGDALWKLGDACNLHEGVGALEAYEGAVEAYTEGLKREPRNASAWRQRGVARANAAIYRKEEAGGARPEGAKRVEGMFEEAVKDLDRSLELGPMDGYAWGFRANAKVHFGNWLEGKDRVRAKELWRSAIADYERAAEVMPATSGHAKEMIEELRRKAVDRRP